MKLARILLASAAVALLAACGTDPVGPSDSSNRIKPRHTITVDSTSTHDTVSGDAAPDCGNLIVVLEEGPASVPVCDGRGPIMGSGV